MANEFYPFATDGGANVVSLASYIAASMRTSGFHTGVADSSFVNRAIRQSALMSSAVGKFISDNGFDALDNGDPASLAGSLSLALSARSRSSLVWSSAVAYQVGALVTLNGELFQALAANTNSPPPNGNWRPVGNGLSIVNVAGAGAVTLSDAQVSSRQIYFVGALTGPRTVSFPLAVDRVWTILNLTTGSFTTTVQGTVGSGTVLPQGTFGNFQSDNNGVRAFVPGFTTSGGGALFTQPATFSSGITSTATYTQTNAGLSIFQGKNASIAAAGVNSGVDVQNDPSNSASSAAFIRLVRSGLFAANFGIDTDNRLKWGGGTHGTIAYDIWNALTAPASLSAGSGYQVFPSGFIIQGALTSTAITAEGPYTVTFPTAFPNGVIAVVPIIRNTAAVNNVDYWAQYVSSTPTTATFYAQQHSVTAGPDGNGLTYIAIGY